MTGGRAAQQLWAWLAERTAADTPPLPLGKFPEERVAARITDHDAALLLEGVEAGLVLWRTGTRFDTLDRPMEPRGRWWLTECEGDFRRPCWEFVPQLAAYVEIITRYGYQRNRVLFDTPQAALQLDLAVLADDGETVVVLGEAKKESKDLDRLEAGLFRHLDAEPEPKRGDEPRQLAWRLWVTRAPYLWLIGPSDRRAFECSYDPLRPDRIDALPHASTLGLDADPGRMLPPPQLWPPAGAQPPLGASPADDAAPGAART